MAIINTQLSQTYTQTNAFLWLEWTALYVLAPLALRFWWRPQLLLTAFLVTSTAVTVWLLRRQKFERRLLWWGNDARGEFKQLKRILQRFFVCGSLIAALVLFALPSNFLDLPRENPLLWTLVMILYPILSVYPQELIYRTFFFERYRPIFPNHNLIVAASAATFGLIHIIFQNPIAVLMTLVGGIFFAETYARTRSLRLVWLEHALYGCLIFTIGLGEFFCHTQVSIVNPGN